MGTEVTVRCTTTLADHHTEGRVYEGIMDAYGDVEIAMDSGLGRTWLFKKRDEYEEIAPTSPAVTSDGGSTSYYQLPADAVELSDLIEHKGMSFALGNIFKACYRLGEKDGASRVYDLNKIIFFANRLLAQEGKPGVA